MVDGGDVVAPIRSAGLAEVCQTVCQVTGHPLVRSVRMSGTSASGSPGPVALAFDIGGTKLAAAVVDGGGRVVAEGRVPTVGDGPDVLFAGLVALGDDVAGRSGLDPVVVGVGCGGPMAAHGLTVSPLNIPQWREFPLRARLAAHYGLPVFVDNDAKALALAEGWMGAAQGCTNYLAMVVSTGVGAGVVLDGRLLDGGAGNAGHLGHVIVDPLGRPCACGARGCLEAEVSGTALRAVTGRPAEQADRATRVRTGRLVGRAVASVANLLDLRLAVVAGSVALGFGDIFLEAANAELDRSARLDHSRGARIVPTGCGEHGPLLGAAAVGRRGYRSVAPAAVTG
jgi:glucokinase